MAERENSPPRRAAQNRTAQKRTAQKRSGQSSAETDGKPAAKAAPRRRASGMKVAALACRQLADLTGREPEGVVGLERTEDGWCVEVEVLELRRIPNTTDVLAVYEVTVDSDGDLDSYRRLHRYERGSVREEP